MLKLLIVSVLYGSRPKAGDWSVITLTLVTNDACNCGLDMRKDESNINAFMQTNFDNKPWMLLGA